MCLSLLIKTIFTEKHINLATSKRRGKPLLFFLIFSQVIDLGDVIFWDTLYMKNSYWMVWTGSSIQDHYQALHVLLHIFASIDLFFRIQNWLLISYHSQCKICMLANNTTFVCPKWVTIRYQKSLFYITVCIHKDIWVSHYRRYFKQENLPHYVMMWWLKILQGTHELIVTGTWIDCWFIYLLPTMVAFPPSHSCELTQNILITTWEMTERH